MKTISLKNKVMLGLSMLFFFGSIGILSVKAFTIDTSLINTFQVIKSIFLTSDGSDDYSKAVISLNYSGSSLRIHTGSLDVDTICDKNGNHCIDIVNIGSGGTTTSVELHAQANLPVCNQIGDKISRDGTSWTCSTDQVVVISGGDIADWNSLQNIPSDFSDNTDNVDDADHDATNEIQDIIANMGLQRNSSKSFGLMDCSNGQVLKSNGTTRGCATDELWNTGGGGGINYMNGGVGIGTDEVEEALNLSGDFLLLSQNTNIKMALHTVGDSTLSIIGSDSTLNSNGGDIRIVGGTGATDGASGKKGGDIYINGGNNISKSVDGNVLIANERGRVGIGTVDPQATLDVNGTIIVGSNHDACSDSSDKGKIFYGSKCIGTVIREVFSVCMGSGSDVVWNIIADNPSDSSASCGVSAEL